MYYTDFINPESLIKGRFFAQKKKIRIKDAF